MAVFPALGNAGENVGGHVATPLAAARPRLIRRFSATEINGMIIQDLWAAAAS